MKCEYVFELKVMLGSFSYFIISSLIYALYMCINDKLVFYVGLPFVVVAILGVVIGTFENYGKFRDALCSSTTTESESEIGELAADLLCLFLAVFLLWIIVVNYRNDFFYYNVLAVYVINFLVLISVLLKSYLRRVLLKNNSDKPFFK